ncbi:MAG: hypothetical protein WBN40_02770 [Pseudomonadales bacterium]
MKQDKVIGKYLESYACKEASQALVCMSQDCISQDRNYEFSIGVPAFDERPGFIETVLPTFHAATLLILVVNRPKGSVDNANNRALMRMITSRSKLLASSDNLALYRFAQRGDILLVDRSGEGRQIPRHQGVGMARKIAADIALALHARKQIASPWLCATDADAELPAGYFDTVQRLPDAAACVFPFYHHADSNVDVQTVQSTRLYENKIRAYVRGLEFAGSPYAYHTIGSTLCVNAWHYAAVRGYPPRSAGEDFYLLNKLRKTGDIISLANPAIALRARRSTRTPFGTGASVAMLADACDPDAAIFYHPVLFVCLRALLAAFDALAAQRSDRDRRAAAGDWGKLLLELLEQGTLRTQLALLREEQIAWERVAATMLAALEKSGFARALTHCDTQAKNPAQYRRQLHNWFDAFRSLRWLHELRGSGSAFANVGEAQNNAIWDRLASLETRQQYACGRLPALG